MEAKKNLVVKNIKKLAIIKKSKHVVLIKSCRKLDDNMFKP